jgi:hypothetical protein
VSGPPVRELADRLEIDKAQVSRIQTGKRLPDAALVEKWLDACQVSNPAARRDVLELLEVAHARTVAWRSAMRAGSVQHLEREQLEVATLVCSFQPVRVPGMLQTLDYARLVLRQVGAPGTDVERSARDRIANQAALVEPGRRFVFVIGERVLARDYGYPGLLAAQRDHLERAATADTVEVLVLPDSALVSEVPFTIYDEPPAGVDADPLVRIELPIGRHDVEGPDEVAAYRTLFERLRRDARPLA